MKHAAYSCSFFTHASWFAFLLLFCRYRWVHESRHLQSDLHQPEGRVQVWMPQRLSDGSDHRRLQGCWWVSSWVNLFKKFHLNILIIFLSILLALPLSGSRSLDNTVFCIPRAKQKIWCLVKYCGDGSRLLISSNSLSWPLRSCRNSPEQCKLGLFWKIMVKYHLHGRKDISGYIHVLGGGSGVTLMLTCVTVHKWRRLSSTDPKTWICPSWSKIEPHLLLLFTNGCIQCVWAAVALDDTEPLQIADVTELAASCLIRVMTFGVRMICCQTEKHLVIHTQCLKTVWEKIVGVAFGLSSLITSSFEVLVD